MFPEMLCVPWSPFGFPWTHVSKNGPFEPYMSLYLAPQTTYLVGCMDSLADIRFAESLRSKAHFLHKKKQAHFLHKNNSNRNTNSNLPPPPRQKQNRSGTQLTLEQQPPPPLKLSIKLQLELELELELQPPPPLKRIAQALPVLQESSKIAESSCIFSIRSPMRGAIYKHCK